MTISSQRVRGFTLTELLVVMGIIALLSGLLVPAITTARKFQKKKNAKNKIIALDAAIQSYQLDAGDYPPTDIELWYDTGGNGVNSGVESLVAHIFTHSHAGPYLPMVEDDFENTDGDSLADPELLTELNWIFGDGQLRELVDPWGNPLVYYHSRDYNRPFDVIEQVSRKKTKATVSAARSEKTATYQSPTSYQIWSFGPDEKNQNGESDDIGSSW